MDILFPRCLTNSNDNPDTTNGGGLKPPLEVSSEIPPKQGEQPKPDKPPKPEKPPVVLPQVYLIAGLGNPGREYAGTRHNVGFEILNKLAFDHKLEWRKMKFRSAITEGTICGRQVYLIKPHTFMNLSGEAVSEFLRFYEIPSAQLIVAYDDTDIALGSIRVRVRGSAGGHNGIKNIIQHVPAADFIRIRTGIGKKPPQYDLADFVLSKFHNTEHEEIVAGITRATDAIEAILADGVEATMNKYN